jgi:hypothetical protein
MSFYLGVWNSPTAISDDEAGAEYHEHREENSVESEFDAQVYGFYSRLTRHYPEVEMVPEDELDGSPWACSLDVTDIYVIIVIQPEKPKNIFPFIRALAAQYKLVCFDPQARKVHLPPYLTV